MINLFKKVEKYLPLYEISKKIKQQYLDGYDNQFFKQIRFCNIVASLLYTLFNVYEIYGGVSGMYLVFNGIFVSVGVFVLLGVMYAYITQKIYINYWLCLIFVLRINVGLLQYTFSGSQIFSGPIYSMFWAYNSYTACDVLLYLINNVSHKKKIIAPVIVHLFSVGSLFYCVFSFLEKPRSLIDWCVVGFYAGAVFLTIVYKLAFQKIILEQVLLSIQTKQESKEYILDILQEGIMIISQRIERKKGINKNLSVSQIEQQQQNEYKIDFMNNYFKQIIDSNLNEHNVTGLQEVNIQVNNILNKEILEEFIQQEQQEKNLSDQEQINENKPSNQLDQIEKHFSKLNMGKKVQYSIKSLLLMDYKEIEKKVFNLTLNQENRLSMQKERFVQIKIHKVQFEDHNEIALQIIDISLNIINKQIKIEIDLENQIRGYCCHELRNPLNSIINSAELIENFLEEAEEEKNQIITSCNMNEQQLIRKNKINKNLKILKYSSKMLKFFVQDMLDFQLIKAEKVSKDLQSFVLREAIEEVVQMLEYMSENSGVKLIIEYRNQDFASNPDYKIKTDCHRLQQILLNLYSNALKYSRRGGFVKIIVDIANQTDPFKRSNKLIKITVWDNGLGISVENQKKLFKLFGKIENDQELNKKGIGLGLYICKMIANQFEGDITVESELGIGSIFSFTMEIFEEAKELQIQNIQKSDLKEKKSILSEKKEGGIIILCNDSYEQEQNQKNEKGEIKIQFDDFDFDKDSNEINSEQMDLIMNNIIKTPTIQLQQDQQPMNGQIQSLLQIQKLPSSLQEPQISKILLQTQSSEFKGQQKGNSFLNFQNDQKKLMLNQTNQNVKNPFKLRNKQDLLFQIQEFKNQLLINIDDINKAQNSQFKEKQLIQNHPILRNIIQFYKKIEIMDDENKDNDEEYIEKYFNDFQRQKTQMIQKIDENQGQKLEQSSENNLFQLTENQFDYEDQEQQVQDQNQ